MRIKKRNMKTLKAFGVYVVAVLLLMWLLMTIATELFKHQERTLDFLTGIDSIKPWFFVLRLALYSTIYLCWRLILTKLQPSVSEEKIIYGRRILIRLFIVYELFFGINIIGWITR